MKNIGKTHEEWEALEAAERKTFKGKIKYAWEDYLYYPVVRAEDTIVRWIDEAVARFQRARRSYADRDAWAVNYYLDSFMPELLRHMIDDTKGGGNGYPGEPYGPEADTAEHWQATVEKMAKGFEASRKQENLWEDDKYRDAKVRNKEWERLEKERVEGMNLFVKYYHNLWD